jgi:rhomboid protease GluP
VSEIEKDQAPGTVPDPAPDAQSTEETPAKPAEPEDVRNFHLLLQTATPRTFVSWFLLGANAAVFLAMAAGGAGLLSPEADKLIAWGADYGPKTLSGQPWRLLTAMFVHIGIVHLACNMWALWQVGPFVERLLGNASFAVLYLLAGLAGGLTSLAWNPYIVSAGASGAIFGVFGAIVACLIRLRRQIPVSALAVLWKSTLICVAFNVYLGITTPGIDNAAHLGGLAAGLIVGLALVRPLAARPSGAGWRRPALVTVAGIALLAVGAAALPRGMVDYQGEIHWFVNEESLAVEAHNRALGRYRKDSAQSGEFADAIEKEVAPRWREMQRRMGAIEGLPRRNQEMIGRLAEYAGLRLKAADLFVQGLRQNRGDLIKEAAGMQERAGAVLHQKPAGRKGLFPWD